jgi:2-keto-4-pentenoate hydratase/2-oxohepta-3-ene-1,7-dioic acid hydratase in catechol pathway
MRLVRFQTRNGISEFAWVDGEQLFRAISNPLEGKEVGEFIANLPEVKLLAPCIPGKVIALGINYAGATGYTSDIKEPLIFLKSGTSVCGPGDDIVCPFRGVRVWGEPELAIVISRRLRQATSLEEARLAIFGYTLANDVSADNIAGRDHHLARSKSADTFCPLGPWVDTDYNPSGRIISGYQNGELIRQGNTDDRIWKEVEAIYWLSQWMTLEPWDVILTGTPPRVRPRRYLANGDIYTVEIEGLGMLSNRFRFQAEVTDK